MVALHVLFGLLGIGSGALALGIAKGSRLHMRSGQVFVATMLLMAASGLTLAILRANALSQLNGVAAALTAYLVITGWLAIRQRDRTRRSLDAVSAAVGFGIAATAICFGMSAASGPPAPAYLAFATVALLAAAGDMRQAVSGSAGVRALARHLWRMGAALWIATASFFLGQARVFPEPLRRPALLAVPVLVVLVAVTYWFVRVRFSRASAAVLPPAGR